MRTGERPPGRRTATSSVTTTRRRGTRCSGAVAWLRLLIGILPAGQRTLGARLRGLALGALVAGGRALDHGFLQLDQRKRRLTAIAESYGGVSTAAILDAAAARQAAWRHELTAGAAAGIASYKALMEAGSAEGVLADMDFVQRHRRELPATLRFASTLPRGCSPQVHSPRASRRTAAPAPPAPPFQSPLDGSEHAPTPRRRWRSTL